MVASLARCKKPSGAICRGRPGSYLALHARQGSLPNLLQAQFEGQAQIDLGQGGGEAAEPAKRYVDLWGLPVRMLIATNGVTVEPGQVAKCAVGRVE